MNRKIIITPFHFTQDTAVTVFLRIHLGACEIMKFLPSHTCEISSFVTMSYERKQSIFITWTSSFVFRWYFSLLRNLIHLWTVNVCSAISFVLCVILTSPFVAFVLSALCLFIRPSYPFLSLQSLTVLCPFHSFHLHFYPFQFSNYALHSVCP